MFSFFYKRQLCPLLKFCYICQINRSIVFSKACEYGIKATLYVAQESLNDQRVGVKDITNHIGTPEAFTAKILQQLVKNKIIRSIKGPHGGFEIPRADIDQIKLSRIVDAIDGDAIYRGCALGLDQCDATKPCPVHDRFIKIRDDLQEMLENTSIYELAAGLETGMTFLRR